MEAAVVSRQGGSHVLGSDADISLGAAIHFRVEYLARNSFLRLHGEPAHLCLALALQQRWSGVTLV